MTSPLSPAKESALNTPTPTTATKRNYEEYEVRNMSNDTSTPGESSRGSPPLPAAVSERIMSDQENFSASKRHSRVLSGNELSPLKILTGKRESLEGRLSDKLSPPVRSPRKVSPDRRFPIKVTNSVESPRPTPHERAMSLEDAVRENEGLKRAIEIFEDDASDLDNDIDDDSATATVSVEPPANGVDVDDSALPDDSMVSAFSTFSAVPNLTMFAKLGQTPTGKTSNASPSRTPRPANTQDHGNTTNLLDFTEQLRNPQRATPARRGDPSPLRNSETVAATPSRAMSNLIDFDIPPMPTPRSVPSITPRELESLKSNFLSEISSLRASLSGKEAEVQSLKTAVGDAEKRVGESLEQLREERALKDQLQQDWENRGMEMENVLRKVKEEIMHGHREREELEQKLEESEKRREAAEMMHQEAESKMAGMRAGKDLSKSSPEKAKGAGASTTHEVEVAVERVARELHGLYKSKHETKVTALKKSYEARWEKKVRELESRINELVEENERLRIDRDTNMTRLEPDNTEVEERKAQAVRDSAAIKELTADIQRLEAVVQTVQQDNEGLRSMLEKERIEKGELVQLAEEMMSMQSFIGQSQPEPRPQAQPQPQPTPKKEVPQIRSPNKPGLQSLRGSIGRGSGLKAPGAALRGPHERTRSGGLPRPGGVPRSGIMSSIEKMGNYRGRGHE